MPTATITSRGRVTIPKTVRELLRIEAGDQIDFGVSDRATSWSGVPLSVSRSFGDCCGDLAAAASPSKK